MLKFSALIVAGIAVSSACFAAEKKHELTLSLDDRFVIAESDKWSVDVEKAMPLRFANVRVTPKNGSDFDLMLYFKCDTPDLAHFNSPQKIEKAVRFSSQPFLSGAVEKQLVLKTLEPKGWYGCYVVLTDKKVAEKSKTPEGSFKYIIRGMIRLSPDTALAFSLMTNSLDTPQYKELVAYVCGFAKPKN